MMDFGELRSRLAGEQGSKGWSLVREWAELAWEAEPERFEAEWLPYLVDQVGQWRAKLCDCPGTWKRRIHDGRFAPLQLVRTLYFQAAEQMQLGPWLEAAARSPDLSGVETLSLSQVKLDNALLDQLARLQLPSLRTLDLDNCEADLGRLERAPWLPQLVSLSIQNTRCTADTFARLCDAGLGERLETLHGSVTRYFKLAKGAKPVALGAMLPRMPQLRQLDWRGHILRGVELEALARWGGSPQLTELTLGGKAIEPAAIAALTTLSLPGLRMLTVRSSALDDEAATLIKWAAQQGQLTHLNLADCKVEAAALEAMEQLARLSVLVLSYNAIGDRGVELITRVPWEQLRGLGLAGCGLSRVGAQRLASCEALRRLKRLALAGNRALSAVDMRLLDKSEHLPAHLNTQYHISYLI
jgi:hypothetical protein